MKKLLIYFLNNKKVCIKNVLEKYMILIIESFGIQSGEKKC